MEKANANSAPTEVTFDSVADVLRRNGPAVGLKDNPVQQSYADFISEGIATARAGGTERPGGQLFAEAETGVGKTIGYLVAAGLDCVKHGSRAIVATNTLALQHQIMHILDDGTLSEDCDMAKALAIIEQETGKRLKAALRIGRRNFIDSQRVQEIVPKLKQDKLREDDQIAIAALVQWAKDNPGGDVRDFLESSGLDALPAGITQDDLCVTADTDRASPSWLVYQDHADAALDADIVVTNHAMLARQALAVGSPILEGDPEDDPRPLGVVIVDECDRFPSAADSAASELVPINQFTAAIHAWNAKYEDGRGDKAMIAIAALRETMNKIRASRRDPEGQEVNILFGDLPPETHKTMSEQILKLGMSLSPLMTSPAKSDDAEESVVRSYAQGLANVYRAMVNKDGNRRAQITALRWSPTRLFPSLRLFRLHPARLLKSIWSVWNPTGSEDGDEADNLTGKDLFGQETDKPVREKARALILTSATVSAPTKNDKPNLIQMEEAFGLWGTTNACAEMNDRGMVFTPKRFGKVDMVFSDPGGPSVYLDEKEEDEHGNQTLVINPEWVDYNAKIVAAARAMGGRTLVATISYRAASAIAEALKKAGLPVIEKTAVMPLSTCIKRLVDDPNGVFITPGSWEGFDISRFTGPDNKPAKLKHVVMTQIPFTRTDGSLGLAITAEMQRRGMTPDKALGVVHAQATANAARKAKQLFGRGIRGADDDFTFWVGDARFPRTVVFQSMMKNNPNVRTMSVFANIIPRRFRVSATGPSVWDKGRVFTVKGVLLSKADVLNMASSGSAKKAA